MDKDILTIILGFLEGFALIVSPCILPILPIFLATSLSGSKKRPLGIILGFSLCFALIALLSRKLIQILGIDLNALRTLSYILLFLLGIVMLSPYLSDKFSQLTARLTRVGENASQIKNKGFGGGFLLGSLLALIWTPCAGPILAAIIVQIVVQKTTFISLLTLFAFALGASIPMFFIVFLGRKLIDSFSFFKTYAKQFRQGLGIIIIASVAYNIWLEKYFINTTTTSSSSIKTYNYLQDALWRPYKAPDIGGIDAWINSPPLQLDKLQGKVVLLDFWTYSCINCLRTLPYLKDWYNKYHDKGLVIIGIHTPEFEFEKNLANVTAAVKLNKILYPVALDNKFVTWQNYSNHFWPAHYLINPAGKVVYHHFGEGDYDVTESNIRFLLGIKNPMSTSSNKEKYSFNLTPETYLGYARANIMTSPSLIPDKPQGYKFDEDIPINAWSLAGTWLVKTDKLIAFKENASIKLHFNAAKVYAVMGSSTQESIPIKVLLNGKVVKEETINRHKLYTLINLNKSENGILEIISTKPGLEIYTFTFGN